MLTRLEVDGFKNLSDVVVEFGPFTCVAGPNGVGKSNLFDAIAFLSALARGTLLEAALSVRGAAVPHGEVESLFQRLGDERVDRMRFAVEMIVPEQGLDALGQVARASMTFLRYELVLRYRRDASIRTLGTLAVEREQLTHINKKDAKRHLPFEHSAAWRDSVVRGRRTSPYISTTTSDAGTWIELHADTEAGRGGGRPSRAAAATLPRTMLSSVSSATEHRTVVQAKNEMSGWMQLGLEPSALRAPDDFTSPRSISSTGAHLPATLHHLAQAAESESPGGARDVYARVANRVSELVEDVRALTVEVDEKRQSLSVLLTDRTGTRHVAGALSDGTLRFMALTVMEADPRFQSLVCLEEPENGIHPSRVRAVIRLLGDLAVDAERPIDEDNPLRQVLINTHSPTVVSLVHEGSLLAMRATRMRRGATHGVRTTFHHLPDTWRAHAGATTSPMPLGELLAYLDPVGAERSRMPEPERVGAPRSVADRVALQMSLPLLDAS